MHNIYWTQYNILVRNIMEIIQVNKGQLMDTTEKYHIQYRANKEGIQLNDTYGQQKSYIRNYTQLLPIILYLQCHTTMQSTPLLRTRQCTCVILQRLRWIVGIVSECDIVED
jgi:hypothetical protein